MDCFCGNSVYQTKALSLRENQFSHHTILVNRLDIHLGGLETRQRTNKTFCGKLNIVLSYKNFSFLSTIFFTELNNIILINYIFIHMGIYTDYTTLCKCSSDNLHDPNLAGHLNSDLAQVSQYGNDRLIKFNSAKSKTSNVPPPPITPPRKTK